MSDDSFMGTCPTCGQPDMLAALEDERAISARLRVALDDIVVKCRWPHKAKKMAAAALNNEKYRKSEVGDHD